jgi:phosphatidylglycerophosphatase A
MQIKLNKLKENLYFTIKFLNVHYFDNWKSMDGKSLVGKFPASSKSKWGILRDDVITQSDSR